LEPDAPAALAGLVHHRIALVLALHREQAHVVHRALAGVLLGVGAAAHRLQRGQTMVEEDTVQIRDGEPETPALGATEEEPVLCVGELGHLGVVSRAIHGSSCSVGKLMWEPSAAPFRRATGKSRRMCTPPTI